MEIKNLKKAAKRIIRAIKNKEKIILYGDSDLDGVASVIVLKEAIESRGGKFITVYFPDREKEGYGLNNKALKFLKKEAPALLILLDCGISNFKEAKLAKKLNFELIIIDHHQVLDKLPEASIIVDPKQKGDNYPFKDFATSALSLKLAQIILAKRKSESLEKGFLELVALSTIADMMTETGENKVLIEEGLNSLKNSFRPGLLVFREINSSSVYHGVRQLVQKIISTLSAADVKNHLNEAYLLLISTDFKQAKRLLKKLLIKGEKRKRRIKEIVEEVEEMIFKKPGEILVFEGNSAWPLTLLGPVASKICQKFKKPTFLFKKQQRKNVGAVRTPLGINGVEAMNSCSNFLETYGGHPPAAGFTIRTENLEKFKECLIKYFKNL